MQVAANDTGVMSDGTNPQVSSEDNSSPYVVVNDGTTPKDHRGNPLKIPPGVSLEDNARLGESYAQMIGDLATVDPDAAESSQFMKDGIMVALFARCRGTMDYQTIYGSCEQYNTDYIDIGNYNYGVVAAAMGYSYEYATRASGFVNIFGGGKKDGPWFNNSDNLKMIRQGFDDYKAGKISTGTP